MTVLPLILVAALVSAQSADDKKKPPEKPAALPGATVPADMLRLADEKAAAGDLDGAAELLRKAAAAPGATGEPSLRLGKVLETKHELDTAIDAYQAAANGLSGAAKGEALARLSIAQNLRGVSASAVSAEAAVAADPEGAWPASALAIARGRQGKADEALALARKAEAAGGGAPAQTALGAAHEAAKDLKAAEEAYRAAGGATAADVTAAVGLARVLRLTRRAAEAEPLLQKVVTDTPGAVAAYKESARVKMALGRGADAMADGALAMALAEGDPEVVALAVETTVARSLDYVAAQKPDLAVQDLTKLRDSQPDAVAVRLGLAKALIAKRQTDAAIVELKKAVELAPASAEAHYQLGVAQHMHKQNAAAAVPSFEKAAAADPGNPDYGISLGAALLDAKLYDRAVAALTPVTQSAPKRPEGWIYLGAAQLQAKRYKEAVAALDKAAALVPPSAQVEAYLAWSYFGLKDAAGFKLHGGKARTLGHKEATLLQYLTRIEGGEVIK
jgi:tetratricopeptide (TPR) repeat protein